MTDAAIKPSLFIQITHTGVLADGRPNTNPVLITDLDVGYENALRKVPVYVPVGGSIIIPASSRSLFSFQQGVIAKFAEVGVVSAKMFYQPERFTTAARPAASNYPTGVVIWNEDEHAPNYADGVSWVSFAAGGPPAPHETSHLPGGTDALATGVPVDVGVANAEGTAEAFARSDHVHNHGSLPGGTLHAEASSAVDGFMSAADKGTFDTVLVPNSPTLGEKAALGGTSGAPSGANPYVTTTDSRMSNARTPLAHEATHATGGIDALTVDTATATNNSSTTGLSVNSATANISVTDPGHLHTINAATATNTTFTRIVHETMNNIQADGTTLVTITSTAASATPSLNVGHLRVLDASFPNNWNGGTLTVNGFDINGNALADVFTSPVGGGTAHGTSTYATISNVVNSVPAGSNPTNAKILTSFEVGIINQPVTAFLKCVVNGSPNTFSFTDTIRGLFDITGGFGGQTVEVWYSVVTTITQNSHTHTMNTATTGVTSSDAGHSHGTTDPGHDHTQNPHAHNLT